MSETPEVIDYQSILRNSRQCTKEAYLPLIEKWRKTPLLDGVSEDHALVLAVLLENYRLDQEGQPQEMGLRVITKVFSRLLNLGIINIHSMAGPNDKFFYEDFVVSEVKKDLAGVELCIKEQVVSSKSLFRKTPYSTNPKMIEDMASELFSETFREILYDIRNNAGTLVKKMSPTDVPSADAIRNVITEMNHVIHRKTLFGPATWIVTGPEIASVLSDAPVHSTSVEKIGQFMGMDVIVDPLHPLNQIVIGRFNPKKCEPGYHYAPYLPIRKAPTVLSNETFEPSNKTISRHGKRLVSPKPYGRIMFETMSDAPNEKTATEEAV